MDDPPMMQKWLQKYLRSEGRYKSEHTWGCLRIDKDLKGTLLPVLHYNQYNNTTLLAQILEPSCPFFTLSNRSNSLSLLYSSLKSLVISSYVIRLS